MTAVDIEGRPVPPPRTDYYVYGYFEPGSPVPFYIGKGVGGRARSHLRLARKGPAKTLFYWRLKVLRSQGIEPDVRLLHTNLTDSEARDKEIDLIAQWGRIDTGTGCLCNHTRGGDGVVGGTLQLRMPSTTRKKLALAQPHRKSVEAFDSRTGSTVKVYTSITSAVADGFNRNCVKDVCIGRRKSHRGLGWRYLGEKVDSPVIKDASYLAPDSWPQQEKPIESLDLASGEVVKWYPSISNAVTDGFTQSGVTRTCQGKLKSHKGFGWRYATKEETQ